MKFRPSKEEIDGFQAFTLSFWNAFKTKLKFINEFLNTTEQPVGKYRNNENGGNLVFRPIGFLPLVKSVLTIHNQTNKDFNAIFSNFDRLNFDLSNKPWLNVLWNPIERKMHSNQDGLVQLLLIYLYDSSLLGEKEIKKLKEGYASKISYQNDINGDELLSFSSP